MEQVDEEDVGERDVPCQNCGEVGMVFYESSLGGIICENCGLVMDANQVRNDLEPERREDGTLSDRTSRPTSFRFNFAQASNLNKVCCCSFLLFFFLSFFT